jgi:hypothetical protein
MIVIRVDEADRIVKLFAEPVVDLEDGKLVVPVHETKV